VYEEEQQWLHAVVELNGTLDALDPSTGSEVATVSGFHTMNTQKKKQRDEFNTKKILPALYSHLYLKSESCWDLKSGGAISWIESTLKPFADYDIDVHLAEDRTIDVSEMMPKSESDFFALLTLLVCVVCSRKWKTRVSRPTMTRPATWLYA